MYALRLLALRVLLLLTLFEAASNAVTSSGDWTVVLFSKHVHDVHVVVVPDAWPFQHEDAGIQLPDAFASFSIPQEEHDVIQSKSRDVDVDFFPVFCMRVFKFDAAVQAAQPEFCCNDTVISLSLSSIFSAQRNVVCYDGRCSVETSLPRIITSTCSAALLAAGFHITYDHPYQIRTIISVETFSHASVHELPSASPSPPPHLTSSFVLDSRNGLFGDFFIFKKARRYAFAIPTD
jgi:hypothetical protein